MKASRTLKRLGTLAPKGPVALLVVMVALASATSVALADSKKSKDQPTTTAEDTTSTDTSTSSDTTTTSDETSTSDETTSDELDDNQAQTTTTSDELNQVAYNGATIQDTTTGGGGQIRCDPAGHEIENPEAGATDFITVTQDVTTVTFTFVWGPAADDEQPSEGTWTSSAPFTGQIIVKSANDPAGGSDNTVYEYTGASSGAITSPAFNEQGIRQGISHIELCLESISPTTTSTSTVTNTTTSTSTSTISDTSTGSTSSGDTSTGSTSTGSAGPTSTSAGTTTGSAPTPTGGVAGETGGGGGGGQGGAGGDQGDSGNGNVASEAAPGKGNLPFTGLHAPLLALIGIGMAIGGFAIRRSLQDSA